MAFIWFIFYACITQVQAGISSTMTQYDNSTAYPTFELADAFMMNFWNFFLVLVFFGLFLWALIYSQRKGQAVGGY